MANTRAVFNYPTAHFDMVRVGWGMYGTGQFQNVSPGLTPVMSFTTQIGLLRKMNAGTPISYGGKYITSRICNIATLPVGFADGIPKNLTNNLQVTIQGKRYPIAGGVSMNLTSIDLGEDWYPIGTEVEIIGSSSNSAHQLAQAAGTVHTQITQAFGCMNSRFFI